MKIQTYGILALSAMIGAIAGPVRAGEVDVENVVVSQTAAGVYRFDVTLRHADSGWDHYADRWEVLAPDGTELARRVLLHPHDDEQPFTRGLPRVEVPEGLGSARVRAHDSVHGYGGAEMTVRLAE